MTSAQILLDHGSGGLASQQLINDLFLRHLPSPLLAELEDSTIFTVPGQQLAMSTDSYVVDPIFFPGGNIGMLAIHGTINDLAMRGAMPLYLSLAFIIEEGLPVADLERILASIGQCCEQTGVPIITGDTKVVPRGKGDKIFINTSGIGLVAKDRHIAGRQTRQGDKILLSGTMANHGLTIMTRRAGLQIQGDLQSDTMALHGLVEHLCRNFPGAIHTLRDPTRGGVATTLCEIAAQAKVAITLQEEALPIEPQVKAGCEILGLDPLYLANEGKMLVITQADAAEDILLAMRKQPEGRDAALIGEVGAGPSGRVNLVTALGGNRLITPLQGQPLPRIC